MYHYECGNRPSIEGAHNVIEAVYGRKRQVQTRGTKQTGVIDMSAEAVHHKLQNVKEGSMAAHELMGQVHSNTVGLELDLFITFLSFLSYYRTHTPLLPLP